MKAYALDHDGRYWLAYAPNASIAKGMLLAREGFTRSLRCRRWPELDSPGSVPHLVEWGYPGSRDRECGNIIAMPEPFQEVKDATP